MSKVTTKKLAQYLNSLNKDSGEDFPVKIFCSFNQYNIKQVNLYNGTVIIEVGETENPIEDQVGPMLACQLHNP